MLDRRAGIDKHSRRSGAKVAHSAHSLAALRIVAALLFLAHGLTKLVGLPGWAPTPGEQPLMTLLGFAESSGSSPGCCSFLECSRVQPRSSLQEMAVAYWFYHALRGFSPAINGGDAAYSVLFSSASLRQAPAA